MEIGRLEHRTDGHCGTIEIGVRPARIGTKSFELEYELQADG